MNTLRTGALMAAMTALFLIIGYAIGGQTGMVIAFLFAAGGNLFAYWNADKVVLRMYGAHEVDEHTAPDLVHLVATLAERAGLPMPKVHIVDNPQPNAFATGRNPENAAVCVTTGLMQTVSNEELAGVLAHELSHIKHRDTLTMTITATIAGAISMLANFAMFAGMFGGFGGNNGNRGNPLGGLGMILVAIMAPIAAALVQMAISRTREYEADREGAEISGRPLWLASALQRIEHAAETTDNAAADAHPATAHLFIINPLHGGMARMFASHPSTEDRVTRLKAMAERMGQSTPKTSPWS